MSKAPKGDGKPSKKKSSLLEGKKNFADHAEKKDHSLIPKKKKKIKKIDKKEHSLISKKKHKQLVVPEAFLKANGSPNEKPLKLKKKDKKKLLKSSSKLSKDIPKAPVPVEPSPVYPCGVCGKEVNDNDEAILCEAGCTFWYHRHCSGMTNEAYSMLTNEDNAEWVCDKCIATRSVPLAKLKSM